jgi:serine/threonine-protein kinase
MSTPTTTRDLELAGPTEPPAQTLVAPPCPPTVTVPPESGQAPVALVAEQTRGPEGELIELLRRRVRIAVLLFLSTYAAYLARDLMLATRPGSRFQLLVFAVAVPVQLALAALAWSRWPATGLRVRVVEWATLLICWAVVGSTQFQHLTSWPDIEAYLTGPRANDGQVLIANTWMIAWLVLICGYPVLIPNPWRRAMLVAVLMALVPVAVTLLAVAVSPELRAARPWAMFGQYAIWGGLGVGIAAYAARRTDELRKAAYEARRFGQYRLGRRLGRGGMGEVYLAEHLLLKRPSVIKTIRPDRARDPAALSRFEREVRILATLTHPNTVAVFDYGYTADGTFYYAMEYLPGLDLDALVVGHGPLPPGRAVHLLRQVCGALREAHAAGLIHRDIKPGNVMVCRRGGLPDVAKLLDFGLVQTAEPAAPGSEPAGRLTREGAVIGTPSFMSPEQAAGKPLDARSDVYSFGAMAFFLLTGKPPFERGGVMETIAAHLLEPPRPPRSVNPDVPPDLDAVVLRCLAKDPRDRFATVADLDAALRRCAAAAEWDESAAVAWWERADRRPG